MRHNQLTDFKERAQVELHSHLLHDKLGSINNIVSWFLFYHVQKFYHVEGNVGRQYTMGAARKI
jgi:hypothetical protein